MKKIILSIITTLLFSSGFAQLKIEDGANWVVSGNATVVLNDIGLYNNGVMNAGTGSFKFTGSQNSGITGVNLPAFYILEIAKTNNAKVQLARPVNINSSLNFISGLFDIGSNRVIFASNALIAGETETNRVIGGPAGHLEITQNLNSPNSSNPGNFGASITSNANLGSVIIRRFHYPESGNGLSTVINRSFWFTPTNNSNLNATLRFRYFDAELNGQNENSLVIYQGDGSTWANIGRTSNSTNANYVEKTGLSTLTRFTLANDNSVVGAVTGLVFTGQRKKATEVQLNWTSQTETNLSGYRVQRKLDTEADFSDRTFVASLAPNGNSISPLNYLNIDANAHTGTSYYRLQIIDKNNVVSYSNIISVAPKTKGVKGGGNNNNLMTLADEEILTAKPLNSISASPIAKIVVGPNPNNGNFWFRVNGIEKETIATLYTIDGKMMQQFKVFNLQQQNVNGLRCGMYLLKIPGFETQKIIVNGQGVNAPTTQQATFDKTKL